jgi:hypothetical protein
MSDADINHLSVLMVHLIDQNRAVLEAVGDIRAKVEDLPTRTEFNDLQRDVKTIKAAVTDVSIELERHKSLPAHVAHGHV